jgi:anti-anti-sigma factor
MDAPTTLALGAELTIAAAAEQHQQLLHALADAAGDATELALDLGHVEACDSAGVQLLLAARASAAARGVRVRLAAASAPVRQALATFGLAGAFADAVEG